MTCDDRPRRALRCSVRRTPFSTPTVLADEPSYSEIRVADLNEDGAPDLVARGEAGADIYLSHP